ncbi:MAG: FkbM family methyltransferase [Vicinamibacterales bacterium]
MLRLSTATKIKIAGGMYRVIRAFRRLSGRSSDTVVCRRQGVLWSLDLRDGIPLAIYAFGSFERGTARALRQLLPAGGVAIDIGANVGAHALPMARRVGAGGRVIAVEPTASAFAALRRNLELNPDLASLVTAYQAAVLAANEIPPSELYSSWPVTGVTQNGHAVHHGVRQSTRGAFGITLDDLVARDTPSRVDVVKLDIDGGEVAALRGGLKTLRDLRPALVLELCPYALEERGASLAALLQLLDESRYQLLDERSRQTLGTDAHALARAIPPGGSINVLALPRERTRRQV